MDSLREFRKRLATDELVSESDWARIRPKLMVLIDERPQLLDMDMEYGLAAILRPTDIPRFTTQI